MLGLVLGSRVAQSAEEAAIRCPLQAGSARCPLYAICPQGVRTVQDSECRAVVEEACEAQALLFAAAQHVGPVVLPRVEAPARCDGERAREREGASEEAWGMENASPIHR